MIMVMAQIQTLKADMATSLSELTEELQSLGDRVATSEKDIVAMSQELEKGQEAQLKRKKDIEDLWDKCTDLEDRSRRDDIRHRNAKEMEKGQNVLDYCFKLFRFVLGESQNGEIPVVRAHRVGARREEVGGRPGTL